jgi:hypothetical protein
MPLSAAVSKFQKDLLELERQQKGYDHWSDLGLDEGSIHLYPNGTGTKLYLGLLHLHCILQQM